MVLGAWCLVSGVWCLVFGVWCLVFRSWCLVFGVWCLVFGAWCLVFGAWCLVHRIWGLGCETMARACEQGAGRADMCRDVGRRLLEGQDNSHRRRCPPFPAKTKNVEELDVFAPDPSTRPDHSSFTWPTFMYTAFARPVKKGSCVRHFPGTVSAPTLTPRGFTAPQASVKSLESKTVRCKRIQQRVLIPDPPP